MFADAIKLIQETAQRAAAYRVEDKPHSPGELMMVGPNGIEFVKVPRRRSLVVHSVSEFVSLAMAENAAAIWHNAATVLAVLDEDFTERPLQTIQLPLTFSEPMAEVQSAWTLDQQGLIRLLTHQMHGCVLNVELASTLRRLKFQRTTAGTSLVEHQASEFGKQVDAAVTTDVPLPDYVDFSVPVYTTPGIELHRETISCSLMIDKERCSFAVEARPDEWTRAVQRAQMALGCALRDGQAGQSPDDPPRIPVYWGAPIAQVIDRPGSPN